VIEVRALTSIDDFREAVRLQKEIWSFSDEDALPVRLFVVCTKIGGQSFGAFDNGRIVGFCIALPGLKTDGTNFLHSNMLGVIDGYRDRGVGRMLKLAQRDDALAHGVRLMEWTFDPLEIKNAYFNMERLGAVVRRYVLNQYGVTSSQLHGGLPTDRCICEWHLDSERVRAALQGRSVRTVPIEARIEVPAGIADIRKQDPEQAREIQRRVSDQFLEFTGRDLAVVGFDRTDAAGVYLFGRWEP
jgi:predicted GNAT superfamily acetyltransferase